jgi:uncharacterized protein YejL (UPF0352 family)
MFICVLKRHDMKAEMKLLVLGLDINNLAYTNCQNLKSIILLKA